ncbi:MAG: hypothetical protein AAF492_13835 [Verrucomicrobiota bacterium]
MKKKEKKKTYQPPTVTRIRLEDRQVVAMAVCKDSLDNTACAQDMITPLFTINKS